MMKMDLRKLSDNTEYNPQTGMPTDETHFECGLPQYLSKSLENMKKSWEIVDSEKRNMHWDICRCELNADINLAEVENLIEAVCLKLPIKTKYKIT